MTPSHAPASPYVKLCECGCGEPAPISVRTNRRQGQVKGQPQRFIHNHHGRLLRHSAATKARMRKAHLGKALSAAHRDKLSESHLGKNLGATNGRWRGDVVSYHALHSWVARRKKKTGKCSTCNFTGETQWANISGVYLRDLDDYAEMCYACHKEFDDEGWHERLAVY